MTEALAKYSGCSTKLSFVLYIRALQMTKQKGEGGRGANAPIIQPLPCQENHSQMASHLTGLALTLVLWLQCINCNIHHASHLDKGPLGAFKPPPARPALALSYLPVASDISHPCPQASGGAPKGNCLATARTVSLPSTKHSPRQLQEALPFTPKSSRDALGRVSEFWRLQQPCHLRQLSHQKLFSKARMFSSLHLTKLRLVPFL